MVTYATSDGSLPLPDTLIHAAVRSAHRRADLTMAGLAATGLFESKPPQLPAAFLLEFSAVMELGVWERYGLREHLDVNLPTFAEAIADLVDRALRGPSAFADPSSAELSERVFRVWVEHFAWEGLELLSTDAVVGDFDNDDFVEELADLIWTHRHELTRLFRQEGHEQ